MKFDIGNLQVAVWQTEEAIDLKLLEIEREPDEELGSVLTRSLAGLESLLSLQQRTLDLLIRQDGMMTLPSQATPPTLSASR